MESKQSGNGSLNLCKGCGHLTRNHLYPWDKSDVNPPTLPLCETYSWHSMQMKDRMGDCLVGKRGRSAKVEKPKEKKKVRVGQQQKLKSRGM